MRSAGNLVQAQLPVDQNSSVSVEAVQDAVQAVEVGLRGVNGGAEGCSVVVVVGCKFGCINRYTSQQDD